MHEICCDQGDSVPYSTKYSRDKIFVIVSLHGICVKSFAVLWFLIPGHSHECSIIGYCSIRNSLANAAI